jgi:signal transduction histidine kinase
MPSSASSFYEYILIVARRAETFVLIRLPLCPAPSARLPDFASCVKMGLGLENPMVDFFQTNRTIVFFVYGQAFFVLGLAVALQSRKHSQIALAKHLWWLAAFGLVHGIYEWAAVFIPIQETYLSTDAVNLLRLLQLALEAISFFALFQFGVELIVLESHSPRLRFAPTVLLAIWFAAILILQTSGAPTFVEFRNIADAFARYFLGVPGAMVAAIGLWQQARAVIQMELPRIARYFRGAAIVFAAYALAASVAPRSNFFPAVFLNYDLLLTTIGVPAAIFRAGCGILIAYLIIRGLEIFDVEAERRLEDALQARAVASDRERIGRELHDGIIQSLYGAGLTLEDAALTIDEDAPRAKQKIAGAIDVLNRTIRDIRAYIVNLRSEVKPMDWPSRLADLVRLFRLQTLINTELKIDGEPRDGLDGTQCSEMLAIAREALINARKHARASRVEVKVIYRPTELELAIADNGSGFALDAHRNKNGEHQGIRNMQERAHLIGGKLEIASTVGRGTTVRLIVPCGKD